MAIENLLRKPYDRFLVKPIVECLYPYPIQAWYITLLAGFTGALVLPALLFSWSWLAILLLVLSGYLDTVDGVLARRRGMSRHWGSVLDIVTDRFVEFVVIMALYLVEPATRASASLFLLGSFLSLCNQFLGCGYFRSASIP